MLSALLPLIASFAMVGCGDSPDNSRPDSAMPIQKNPTAPEAPPKTVDEKIERIKNAPISEKEKQAAIARVRSGKL
jgi:hypothetical protein